MHLAERIKVFLAMRRVKREGKHILLKFKSRPHGVFGVWHLLKSHCGYKKAQKPYDIWVFDWHPNWMYNMSRVAEKDAGLKTFFTRL